MIRVVFKLNKQNGFDNTSFVYADYEGISIGDIVVVNTRYGYAVAQVVEIGCYDETYDSSSLATVKCIIEGKAERDAIQARKDKLNALVKEVKRNQVAKAIGALGLGTESEDLIKSMSEDELKIFLKAIKE